MSNERSAGVSESELRALAISDDFIDADRVSGIYLRAIETPVITRDHLVDGGYPPEDVDEAIRIFEWRGLIQPIDGERWQVVPPDVAMPSFATRLEDHARQLRSATLKMARIYQRGVDGETNEAHNLAELRGLDDISNAIASVVASSTHTLRAIRTVTPYTTRLLDRALDEKDRVMTAAGTPLDIRVVYDLAVLDMPNGLDHLARRARLQEQQRLAPSMPFSLTVGDDARVVIDTYDTDGEATGLLVTTEPGARAARRLFDLAWRMSAPWETTGAAPLVDEREEQILRLLAGGASDSMIARQLGISQRTVERRIHAYMSRVNAITRFQAGVVAAKQGLL